MEFTLIPHAQRRALQRGITRAMIADVLDNPEQVVAENLGRKAYQSRITVRNKAFLLRVIVDDTTSPVVVVTAILTNQIDRYWR